MHRSNYFNISMHCICVTSLPCWGRVVIGSLFVYQTSGAGSNPVVSTTVLVGAIRSIGNGQENCSSCAWESPEKSGLFPITSAYRANLLIPFSIITQAPNGNEGSANSYHADQ